MLNKLRDNFSHFTINFIIMHVASPEYSANIQRLIDLGWTEYKRRGIVQRTKDKV